MGVAVSLPGFFPFPCQNMIIAKANNRIKLSSFKTNIDPKLSISQINIRGLYFNFSEVELRLQWVKSNLTFLSETGLSQSIQVQEFTITGYSPLITRQCLLNSHSGRLGLYIKEGFPYSRESDFSFYVFSRGPRL